MSVDYIRTKPNCFVAFVTLNWTPSMYTAGELFSEDKLLIQHQQTSYLPPFNNSRASHLLLPSLFFSVPRARLWHNVPPFYGVPPPPQSKAADLLGR
jgi:hypothetical protein